MSNPDDLEVIYCHPYPYTWQGLFSRNFISANLTTLPGSESYGGSHAYHCQNLGTRAKSKYLFDGDVLVIMGKLVFDISIKVISSLVYARPGAYHYPAEDQDR